MKPYVVKLLPVEGEIKEGDTWLCHRNGLTGVASKKIVWFINNEHHSKAKLFLFLRNTNDLKVDVDQQQWQEMSRDEKDDYLIKTNQYKLIGEISSDAKWVKDGDELTYDEVKIFPIKTLHEWLWEGYPNNYIPHERMESIERRYDQYTETGPKIVKVIGSCGHLH